MCLPVYALGRHRTTDPESQPLRLQNVCKTRGIRPLCRIGGLANLLKNGGEGGIVRRAFTSAFISRPSRSIPNIGSVRRILLPI